ncbi:PapB/FocB family fimbrial expression transcriptional regulator [Providencia rustigianii]|uniref:Major pilu subunit operon regulatory protein PapB n=2 Tax=Providencia rustigianii TaxID=158850 RepID=D1P763_9GAMM|nr:PapB/FocB family fimbrial expression transcriptional regulator [Providencia rustigianii]EFB70910.1 major pilu subunit operon regulatory protein PapB [Providencia rustigianii DSM 4541]
MREQLLTQSPYRLHPGKVDKKHLMLLINISSIRSNKVINALNDYFVEGKKRKEICEKHKINQGYLSIKINELQETSLKVYNISYFILK